MIMEKLGYENISFRTFLEGAELESDAIATILEGEWGYEEMQEAFLHDLETFERLSLDRRHALRFFARYAYDTRFEWQREGIPFSIWRDTCTDIGVWQKTYREESGEIGLAETAWLTNHLTRKLFRIGRLQFVPDEADEYVIELLSAKKEEGESVPTLRLGERFYFVHIPRGGALTAEACESSFAQARAFFGGRSVFACDSWILSPKLQTILEPTSNLAAFANRFCVLSVEEESRSAERYLFGKIGDIGGYATATSLQRKAKEYLVRHGSLGTALGIFEMK